MVVIGLDNSFASTLCQESALPSDNYMDNPFYDLGLFVHLGDEGHVSLNVSASVCVSLIVYSTLQFMVYMSSMKHILKRLALKDKYAVNLS